MYVFFYTYFPLFRYVGRESNIWRLVWTPAPPKMLIPPVAVKSVLFPHYHGTQLAVGSSAGDKDVRFSRSIE